jgi:hypothetical protein
LGGPLFYAIDRKGLTILAERGHNLLHRPAPANLTHQVMIDQIMASIAIGVNADPHLELTWWEEIIASDRTPVIGRVLPSSLRLC